MLALYLHFDLLGAKTGDAAPAFTGATAFATLAIFAPATSATVAFALGAAFFATEAYLSMYALAFYPVFPAAGPTEETAPPVFGSQSLRSGLLRYSSRSRRAGSHSSGTSTTGFGTTDVGVLLMLVGVLLDILVLGLDIDLEQYQKPEHP